MAAARLGVLLPPLPQQALAAAAAAAGAPGHPGAARGARGRRRAAELAQEERQARAHGAGGAEGGGGAAGAEGGRSSRHSEMRLKSPEAWRPVPPWGGRQAGAPGRPVTARGRKDRSSSSGGRAGAPRGHCTWRLAGGAGGGPGDAGLRDGGAWLPRARFLALS